MTEQQADSLAASSAGPLGIQQATLRGGHVALCRWGEDDVDFVVSVTTDPLIPLISEVPNDRSVEGARAFIATQWDRFESGRGWAWAMTSLTGGVVGCVGALWTAQSAGRASIGYWRHEGRRRAGFTAEAVTIASDWLLTEGGVARLEAFIEPWNIGSIRVAERAGFEREGLMRSFAPFHGERKDAYLFARIA